MRKGERESWKTSQCLPRGGRIEAEPQSAVAAPSDPPSTGARRAREQAVEQPKQEPQLARREGRQLGERQRSAAGETVEGGEKRVALPPVPLGEQELLPPLVRRHQPWLEAWFDDNLGYRLAVDPEAARLYKRPASGARSRPAKNRADADFDPRRYALFCLLAAALERSGIQTVLSELAEQVQLLAASEPEIENLDLDRYAERQAFVDAARLAVDLGVLHRADGDEQSFLDRSGDVLYDVRSRRLAQLLASPVPPSMADSPEALGAEVYPATDDGANRRIRHRLMRRLVEEPVLYFADLDDKEREYLAKQRPFLIRQVANAVGLAVEVRAEGLAAIDPEGAVTDLLFPGPGTVGHAALLLAGFLAARARAAGGDLALVGQGEVVAELDALLARYGKFWARGYREDPVGLGREALFRLAAMGLVGFHPDGVQPLPAIARFRATEPGVGDG